MIMSAIRMSVGKVLPKKDAWTKANGEVRYSYDHHYPNEQRLYVIRSSQAHAKIIDIHINWNQIKNLNAKVGTYQEIPGKNVVRVIYDDLPLLAEDNVKYVGQPVAIVIAKNLRVAQQAASSIQIEYEELPALFNPLEAKNHPSVRIFNENNTSSNWKQKKGDIEKGFTLADVIVEEEYVTHAQEHVYLEPQGSIAIPQRNGEMTIYSSTQEPYSIRKNVSKVLGYPLSKVTVKQTAIGGAFGGKNYDATHIACLAALGAYLTKKPVKLILSREEDIETTSKRHPAILHTKTGATRDGLLTTYKVEYHINTGAFATLARSTC
jgi:xanthine dehydrogenase molybdopterin-binding subunit B